MSKKFMSFVIGSVLFYVLLCVALYFVQRTMIYFPDNSRPAPIEGVEIVNVTAQDGQKIESWFFKGEDPEKPVIIFFHGNAGHYGQRIHKAIYYISAGYGVLLAEYRGYGGNDGGISEQGLYGDARAQMSWLVNKKGIKTDNIVIYGESLGSGPAIQMATEFPVKMLILEAPFSSLYEIAAKRYFFLPVRFLLKDRYMNAEKIKNLSIPLLIMHGKKDNTIPFSSAKKLYEVANQPKSFIDFPLANHNNLYDFGAYKYVIDFLTGIDAKNIDND